MRVPIPEPAVGMTYWWLQEPRRLLGLTVQSVSADSIEFYWQHNLGMQCPSDPSNGTVTWTRQEFEAARPCLLLYQVPVTAADLGPDEELCHMCNGCRWETERDFELLPCIWCDCNGRRPKQIKSPPTHSQRSDLHPSVPIT